MSIDIEEIIKTVREETFNSSRINILPLTKILEALEQQQAEIETKNASIEELEFDSLFIKHLRKAGIITSALEVAIFEQIEKEL